MKIVEYYITLKNGDELITEDKQEADETFEMMDKNSIEQYFSKEWILVGREWEEGHVVLFYDAER